MKKNEKIILIVGVVGIVVYLLYRQQQQQQLSMVNPYAQFVDAIGGAINSLGNATNSIINTAGENKRATAQQAADNLRDTKDNSLLFSNDILILPK